MNGTCTIAYVIILVALGMSGCKSKAELCDEESEKPASTFNSARAFTLCSASAAEGDREGISYLGWAYWYGDGIAEDKEKAIELWRKASDLGSIHAMGQLGTRMVTGEAIPQDVPNGIALLEKAANASSVYAQLILGKLYLNDEQVKLDYAKAVHWLSLAATNKDDDAEWILGEMYVDGKGVSKNVKYGVQLLRSSAEHGNKFAQYVLAKMLFTDNSSRDTLLEAKKWYSAAASKKVDGAEEGLNKVRISLGELKKFYYLKEGAPICADLRSMTAADAASRAGAIAYQMVLDRYDCSLMPNLLEVPADKIKVEWSEYGYWVLALQGRIMLTTKESLSIEYHERAGMARR